VFVTQILATLIAVFGIFMPPIGWGWALAVWGFSLTWFLVNDRIKLLAYRFFDPPSLLQPSDLTARISSRAYELFEKRGRQPGLAVQDWKQAEREIGNKHPPK
jgi:H+-transporting ATPase